MGVSRTVVREAISRLNAAGIAATRHGIGTFVAADVPPLTIDFDSATKVTVDDALAMLELRISMEVEAAALAAARASDAQVAELEEALERFKRNREASADTIRPDFDFHLKIAEATGNRYFVEIMSRLGTATIPRNRLTDAEKRDPDLLRMIEQHHTAIYQAIRSRDPETARVMMRLHLTASRERLRRARDGALLEAAASAIDATPDERLGASGIDLTS
jgi:DNA-binding FadR family transcriptional regulator